MRRINVVSALQVSKFLWPEFVVEQGCVFLAKHSGSNPPHASSDAAGWEAFVNHIHVFDEFGQDTKAIRKTTVSQAVLENGSTFTGEDWVYDETHPDFIAACELGRTAARLWSLKLAQDFPADRFRVYYTEFDNPIIRFHKVRDNEPFWLTDEQLVSATDLSFRNALIYDTLAPGEPVSGPPATQDDAAKERLRKMDKRDREGYLRQPLTEEDSVWDVVTAWPED